MHSGEHVEEPTAARRMKRQSLAVGFAPEVAGCEHRGSPSSVVVVVESVVDVLVVDVDGIVVDVEVFVVDVDVLVVVGPPSQPGFSGSTKSARSLGAFAASV